MKKETKWKVVPHPQQKLFIDLGIELELGDILRKKKLLITA